MISEHIVSAFDRELGQIRHQILQLSGLVEDQLDHAIEALIRRNPTLANQVIEKDDAVDTLERAIGETVVNVVARRQPVANDLRTVFAAAQIAQSLERVGDFAANTAKRSLALDQSTSFAPAFYLSDYAKAVRGLLSMAIKAYADSDLDLALEAWHGDAAVDRHHSSLFMNTMNAMRADSDNIVAGVHLLFVLKNLERIGDFATSIAESTHFALTGKYPPGERPKADTTSTWVPV
ncbi:MAG: phosphate signaling complex protein PhoU [Alphaproteobacteria bacterium]|jgi:phosphate transport system protein|nr:phosphate signaling complex protein PhoU [Alphaproteobacteria bacterium]